MLPWIHPIMAIITILLGLYALYLGLMRILQKKYKTIKFKWKQHVRFGTITLVLMILLIPIGIYAVYDAWGVESIASTEQHFSFAIIIGVLALIGFVTGYIMNKYKSNKRIILPIIHGLANIAIFVLSIFMVITGYGLLAMF